MNTNNGVYGYSYDWATELRYRIPNLLTCLKSSFGTSDPDRALAKIQCYLQMFLEEASKPLPDRAALSGRQVREFNNLLTEERSRFEGECWEDLIDIVNIIYLQPGAILYSAPGNAPKADTLAPTPTSSPIAWQGEAVSLSPARRFLWPFLAGQRSRRKVT